MCLLAVSVTMHNIEALKTTKNSQKEGAVTHFPAKAAKL